MEGNFFQSAVDSLRSISFDIPDEVFQGLLYLTKFVGYFFPLRLYLPIIMLVLSMVFIQTAVRLISKIAEFGQSAFKFFASMKGK